jgi:hypothetical protein
MTCRTLAPWGGSEHGLFHGFESLALAGASERVGGWPIG